METKEKIVEIKKEKPVKIPKIKKEKIVKPPRKILRKMAFDLFTQESEKGTKLENLDIPETIAKINSIIAENFPESMWVLKSKIHYSYYKSKFIEAIDITKLMA